MMTQKKQSRSERHKMLVKREMASKHNAMTPYGQEIRMALVRSMRASGRMKRAGQSRKIHACRKKYGCCSRWIGFAKSAKYIQNKYNLLAIEKYTDIGLIDR